MRCDQTRGPIAFVKEGMTPYQDVFVEKVRKEKSCEFSRVTNQDFEFENFL